MLRNVQINLVCSAHMTLAGQYYDRAICEQYVQKDILPGQLNTVSWRIDMQLTPPSGTLLCTGILSATHDTMETIWSRRLKKS